MNGKIEVAVVTSWPEKFASTKNWWKTYTEYLSSSEWETKRLQVLARDGNECRVCGDTVCLQAHHKTYARVGNEDVNDLTTLCKPCHDGITRILRRRRKKYGNKIFDLALDMGVVSALGIVPDVTDRTSNLPGDYIFPSRPMTAVDLIAQELKRRNAVLFAGAGGTICPLFDACHRHNVEVIIFRHEQGAGFASIGAFKATRQTQFVAATSGPGATNLVTSIADAYYDSCSVVFLTGQISTANFDGSSKRQQGFQHTPIVQIVESITKFAKMVRFGSELETLFRQAILAAETERRGPALLDLPMNCQKAEL